MLMLFACIAGLHYSGKCQNLKFKGDSLSVAYGYIQKIKEPKPGQLIKVNADQNQWKGRKIDSLEQFDVYQLPVDRMICLVPNKGNPAYSNLRIAGPSNSPAPIPNPLYNKRLQSKR